jgi:hypothetical protein
MHQKQMSEAAALRIRRYRVPHRAGRTTKCRTTAAVCAGLLRRPQIAPKFESTGHRAIALVFVDEQEQCRANNADNEQFKESQDHVRGYLTRSARSRWPRVRNPRAGF